MIPPHMIPAFALLGCCIIMMLTLSVAAVSVWTNEDVQKALEELENEEETSPSPSPSSPGTPPGSPPGPPPFEHPIGTPIKCWKNDPKDMQPDDSDYIAYRVVDNQGKLRYYPTKEIALSWDEDWEYNIEELEDCAGLALGDPMTDKAASDTSSLPPSSSLTWTPKAGKKYIRSVKLLTKVKDGSDTEIGEDAKIVNPVGGIDGCKAKCKEFDSCKSIVYWNNDVCYLYRTNTVDSLTYDDPAATIVENNR